MDKAVLSVQEYAKAAKIDKASSLRYGFLIDNALDYWLRHGGRGMECRLSFGRHFFTHYVCIEMVGEKIDPYPLQVSDYGMGGNDIAVYSGQLPSYEYRDGTNILVLNLKREKKMIRRLCIVAAVAILVGILGNTFLSDALLEQILSLVVEPITAMFFNLLRCIAGPMVFLSVVWGICGVGDSRIFGRIGKSVLLYSFGVTVCGAFVGALFFPFLGNGFSASTMNGGTVSSLLTMILDIVPSSIVEPFSNGNTLQIIFLAIAIGLALIIKSRKVGQLVSAVEQFNLVVQYLMEAISLLVPFVVFLLITDMIWSGSLSLVLSMWKFFVFMAASFVVITLLICAYTSIRQGVGFFTVAKKNLSTFVISLTTASSAASFGENVNTLTKRYGVANETAAFSIPLGMVMHNPVAACYDVLIVIYFAATYGVSCSVGWLVIAVIVSAVIALSTPPIPGGAAASYALLFAQMGIPEEALALVLILDIITDFFVTAFESYILPISLVNIADSVGQLDKDILRNTKK